MKTLAIVPRDLDELYYYIKIRAVLDGAMVEGANGKWDVDARYQAEKSAIILAGLEVGVLPQQALSGGVYVIQGTVGFSANAMHALVEKTGKCTEWIETFDPNAWTYSVTVQRENRRQQTFTKHINDYAHLHGKDNWQKYPDRMLRSKVIGKACKEVFPDVVSGVMSLADLDLVDTDYDRELLDQSHTALAAPQPVAEQQPAAPAEQPRAPVMTADQAETLAAAQAETIDAETGEIVNLPPPPLEQPKTMSEQIAALRAMQQAAA